MEPDVTVICIESPALHKLVRSVITELRKNTPEAAERWINADEAKRLLGVSSPSSLQKLRDEGKIRFAKMASRNILYDRESIMNYVESRVQETF